MNASVRIDLGGPAGRIEALHEEPPAPRFAALVLHPHPLYGGTMHNHATYQIAKAARSQGGVTLRMNFRGVGLSAGSHAGGAGEADDAKVALAWLGARHPGLPLFAGGMSFGAWVALRAASGPEGKGALAAGVALRRFDLDFVRSCAKPVAAVQAEHDEFGAPDEVRALLEGSGGPRRLWVVPGTTHLFLEDLPALQDAAARAWAWLVGEA